MCKLVIPSAEVNSHFLADNQYRKYLAARMLDRFANSQLFSHTLHSLRDNTDRDVSVAGHI